MVFPVRLTGSLSSREGFVEVLYNGVWGRVCNGINDDTATIVCSMLGLGYE